MVTLFNKSFLTLDAEDTVTWNETLHQVKILVSIMAACETRDRFDLKE